MLALLIILLVVAADQASKAWIVAHFSLYQARELIPGLFSLTYLTNQGSAFGFLNGEHGPWRQAFFVGVALLAMLAMLVFLRKLRDESRWCLVAVSLIMGGAAGNLIDRLRLGAVVDFLEFYWRGHYWPAFNVADSAITVGVALFVATQLWGGQSEGR